MASKKTQGSPTVTEQIPIILIYLRARRTKPILREYGQPLFVIDRAYVDVRTRLQLSRVG